MSKRTRSRAPSCSEDGREQKRQRIDGEGSIVQLELESNVLNAGRDVILNVQAGNKQDNLQNAAPIDKRKLAEWLSPRNFHTVHKETLEKVTPGTGEWVLNLPKFTDWMEKESDTLWGTGAPGAGKTCLSAVVINYLGRKLGSDGQPATVIFIYCQYKAQLTTTAQILASLLKQLVEKSTEVAQIVENTLYLPCNNTNTPPSKIELLQALQAVIQMFPRLFIVVDALDELPASICQEVIGHLINLRKSLFLTSRPLLLSKLPNPHFEIRAPPEDFQMHIKAQLNNLPELEMLLDEDLSSSIVDKMETKASGMFLVVSLQLSNLVEKGITCAQDLDDAIQELPSSLEDNYKETLDRICSKRALLKSLALRALLIVTHAAYILKIEELLEALSMKTDDQLVFDKKRRPLKLILMEACLGLLRIEEESQTVHLLHQTAQDFLESRTPDILLFINPHMHMANLCAAYAAYAYQTGSTEFEAALSKARRTSTELACPFFDYAIQHIGHHTCKADLTSHKGLPDQVHDLFTKSAHVLLLPTVDLDDQEYIDLGYATTALYIAAAYGHVAVVKLLLDIPQVNEIAKNAKTVWRSSDNPAGETAFEAAKRNGNTDVLAVFKQSGYGLDNDCS